LLAWADIITVVVDLFLKRWPSWPIALRCLSAGQARMRQWLRNQDRSMHLKLPGPRVRLRTLAILIAAVAVTLWAGLNIWSPTRRLGRLLGADQPVFVRREAASSLGRDIPSWETDRAVSLLINALDDPSPRVREYAGVGLAELGPRAEQAVSKLIAVQTLLLVAPPGAVRSALNSALADDYPETRQWASAQLEGLASSP
jgi:HEAT repeats